MSSLFHLVILNWVLSARSHPVLIGSQVFSLLTCVLRRCFSLVSCVPSASFIYHRRWFVWPSLGINAMDLCLSNCSWVEQYSEDLYPLDAGIDSGKTYTVRVGWWITTDTSVLRDSRLVDYPRYPWRKFTPSVELFRRHLHSSIRWVRSNIEGFTADIVYGISPPSRQTDSTSGTRDSPTNTRSR